MWSPDLADGRAVRVFSSALALLDNSTDTGTTVIAIICALVITVFYLVAMWRIYTKAGKPGWAVIIPIYNSLVLLQIVGRPWWWLLLYLIPLVDIVIG